MQTPESSLEAIANRVAKLEAQNRRLKKAGIASFIVACAVIAMGQAPTKKIVEANEFVLQDASGKTRARLSMDMKDKPALTFFRDQTTPAASLTGGDEPFLLLTRAGTTEQVQVGAKKEFVGLAIYEKEISAGLSLQNGIPGLDLFYENGKPHVTLTGSPTDSYLTMFDTDSKTSLSIGVPPTGGVSQLQASGEKHKVTLTWKGSTSHVAGYNVYRSMTPGGNYTRINTSLVQGLTYTDNTVESGKTYYYATRAVDARGHESVNSNETSAIIP
jgi:hypothetical protein